MGKIDLKRKEGIKKERERKKEKKNEKVEFFLGLLSRGSIVFFVFTQKEINKHFMWVDMPTHHKILID